MFGYKTRFRCWSVPPPKCFGSLSLARFSAGRLGSGLVRSGLVCLGLYVVGVSSITPAASALPLALNGQDLPTLAPMLERVTPAVANIAARGPVRRPQSSLFNDPFFRRFFDVPDTGIPSRSLGSGVIVDAQAGLLITNHHVIKDAAQISVTLNDGRRFDAQIVGTDPESDVAVLKIDASDLIAVPVADSSALRVGDFVVAIGNPFGLGQTVTSGIVSALGRRGLGIEGYEDFIQTDASINVGNSGGALVNLRGELVGINTAILAPNGGSVGIGFAIPSKMSITIMNDLVNHGRVRRGLLGIATQDITPQLAEAFGLAAAQGALIVRVVEGSPANKAGLVPGDVVIAVNGRAVEGSSQLGNAIGLARAGEAVALDIIREGEPMTVKPQLADRQSRVASGGELHPHLEGVLFGETRLRHRDGETYGGIHVVEVEANSAGWRVGLRQGDFVVGANRQRVGTLEDLARVAAAGRGRLMLQVRRGEAGLFVLVE
jgi:Do/DeqQ family serine protease